MSSLEADVTVGASTFTNEYGVTRTVIVDCSTESQKTNTNGVDGLVNIEEADTTMMGQGQSTFSINSGKTQEVSVTVTSKTRNRNGEPTKNTILPLQTVDIHETSMVSSSTIKIQETSNKSPNYAINSGYDSRYQADYEKCARYNITEYSGSGFLTYFSDAPFKGDSNYVYQHLSSQDLVIYLRYQDYWMYQISDVGFNITVPDSDIPTTGSLYPNVPEQTISNFTAMYYGYFPPPITGNYTFTVESANGGAAIFVVDDINTYCCGNFNTNYLFWGKSAYNIPNDPEHTVKSVTVHLQKGVPYQIGMMYINIGGDANFEPSITFPTGEKITNFENYVYPNVANDECGFGHATTTIKSQWTGTYATTYSTSVSYFTGPVSFIDILFTEEGTFYYVMEPSETSTSMPLDSSSEISSVLRSSSATSTITTSLDMSSSHGSYSASSSIINSSDLNITFPLQYSSSIPSSMVPIDTSSSFKVISSMTSTTEKPTDSKSLSSSTKLGNFTSLSESYPIAQTTSFSSLNSFSESSNSVIKFLNVTTLKSVSHLTDNIDSTKITQLSKAIPSEEIPSKELTYIDSLGFTRTATVDCFSKLSALNGKSQNIVYSTELNSIKATLTKDNKNNSGSNNRPTTANDLETVFTPSAPSSVTNNADIQNEQISGSSTTKVQLSMSSSKPLVSIIDIPNGASLN
ncbi:hypothetical protein C6P45_002661, partial [Maudiozyma exigua]